MTIASAITAAQGRVADAYTAISNKGGTLPATQNLSNMPTAINSITTVNNTTLTVTPTTYSQSLTPSSPYTGYGTVDVNAVTSAIDSNIQAGNIKSGVSILGVTGNVTELVGQAGTGQVVSTAGTTFYPSTGYNGFTSFKATPKNYIRAVTPTTSLQTFSVPSGYSGHGTVRVNGVTSAIDANITAGNIKKDVVILGVTGTYEGGGGGGGGGYVLEYLYLYSNGQHMNLTINNTFSYPLFQGSGTDSTYSRVLIPSVEKIKVDSYDPGYRSDCIVEFTSGGVTRALNFGEEVTLSGDSKLKLMEADCLLKGTLITMSDGTRKEISQVKVGDKVMCINEQGLIDEDTVTFADGDTKKYNDNYDLWEFENGYEVRTTHHHRFYNIERQAMVYLDEFEIGEHTIDKDGNQFALLKHTNMEKEVHHFTIATKNWNNYFANGMLCGNRLSTEIHLGTDEQKQVQSTPSANIGTFLGG